MSQIIGAITLGESPRPDLIKPLADALPHCTIIEQGALDGVRLKSIPKKPQSAAPIAVYLSDRTVLSLDASFLLPHIQRTIRELEKKKVDAILLMCAGVFHSLTSTVPLFNPTGFVSQILRTVGIRTIGVVSPFSTQRTNTQIKWQSEGFNPAVWVASPENPLDGLLANIVSNPSLECIVLDYVGHTAAQIQEAKRLTSLPIFDLGHVTLTAAASVLSV